jgi:hypothetical protein
MFPWLLGLLFIVLKLTGYITWSWVWVLAPFWIVAAIAILFVAFSVAMFFVTGILL